MRTSIFLLAVLIATPLNAAEDEYRVLRLEQDVRALEQHVHALERQVLELQERTGGRVEPSVSAAPMQREALPARSEQTWLKASAWNRIRSGMSELQVIEILGKPTAMRPDAQGRPALLYTMEIGTTSFLTGSVTFDSGHVVDVHKPTLK